MKDADWWVFSIRLNKKKRFKYLEDILAVIIGCWLFE